MTSGVRRSPTPRSQPCPASAISAIGSAERRDPQVAGRRGRATSPSPPSAIERRRRRAATAAASATPDRQRQPQRLRGERAGLGVPRPRRAGAHARGRAVGEEDAQRDDAPSRTRRGQRERRELRRAEVADDRRVGEQVERLGGERSERGEREAQDLAVVGGAAHRAPLYDPAMAAGRSCSSPPLVLAACGERRQAAGRGVRALAARSSSARCARAPGAGALCRRDAAVGVRGRRAQRRRPAGRGLRPHARGRRPRRRARSAAMPPRRCGSATSSAPTRRGAARTAGIHAELERRIERAGAPLVEGAPRLLAALRRGPARGRGRRMRLRLYHAPRRRPRRLPRGGHRARPRAAALGAAQPPRVRAGRRAPRPTATGSCSPTCRCTATPRTARAIPTRSTGWPR